MIVERVCEWLLEFFAALFGEEDDDDGKRRR